jgi:hypothetical protein
VLSWAMTSSSPGASRGGCHSRSENRDALQRDER